MRQRDLIVENIGREWIEYFQDHHPKSVEDGTQNNQQHPYQYKTHKVLQVTSVSLRTGELVDLIRQHVPLVGSSEFAEEDLGLHRIAVILDELPLPVLPLHHENRVADRKSQGLRETSRHIHLIREGYLQCEKDEVRDDDAEHIAEDVVVVEYLVGDPLPHVITDHLHVRKEGVVVPVVHEVLVIDAALDFVRPDLAAELLKLVVDGEDVHADFVEVAHLEVLLDQHVAEFCALHVEEQRQAAFLVGQQGLIQHDTLELVVEGSALGVLIRKAELLEHSRLLPHMIPVLGQNLLANIEILPPLLNDSVQLLHPGIDLPPIVLKDIHLLTVGQLVVLFVLEVFIQYVQFLVAGPEVLKLVVVQISLFDDLFVLGLALLDVEVAAKMFLLSGAVGVGLDLGVKLDGPFVLGGGVVEVKIEECVVYLLLDPVLVGHSEEVLGPDGEEQINLTLFYLLIIEDEGLDSEAADMLKGVDHAVVLYGEGVENAIEGIDALEFHDLFLLVLVDELGLLDYWLNGVEGKLHPHPDVVWVHVLLISLHLLHDVLLGLAIHPLQLLIRCGDETRKGKVATALNVGLHGDFHLDDQIRFEVAFLEGLGLVAQLASEYLVDVLFLLVKKALLLLTCRICLLFFHVSTTTQALIYIGFGSTDCGQKGRQ